LKEGNFMAEDVGLIGIQFGYPEFKYSTQELFDILGNKLSDKVKENISQLGVNQRYFIRPIDHYLGNFEGTYPSSEDHKEPISDLAANAAKECISKLGLTPNDITCVLAASENNDYLSPGLSSILIRKIGLSNFIPHFNLQGMACSTFLKVLELGKNLVKNDNDNVLVVISGCNSGWYLPHLKDNMSIKNPSEISKDQYDRQKQIRKWVSTMFSFLFGDGVVAFVLSKDYKGFPAIKFKNFTHAVNFEKYDYRKACVQLRNQSANHLYEFELTAASHVIDTAVDYSKKVLMQFLKNDFKNFDENMATSFMAEKSKIMIHTGSMKILDSFKSVYNLKDEQIQESYETLREYGNLTGCSIPTVMRKAFVEKSNVGAKGLLVGITMGFGLDIVEVEKVS
jgi:3-oxoacyl-[acyl-carrier-protein] synthase III